MQVIKLIERATHYGYMYRRYTCNKCTAATYHDPVDHNYHDPRCIDLLQQIWPHYVSFHSLLQRCFYQISQKQGLVLLENYTSKEKCPCSVNRLACVRWIIFTACARQGPFLLDIVDVQILILQVTLFLTVAECELSTRGRIAKAKSNLDKLKIYIHNDFGHKLSLSKRVRM